MKAWGRILCGVIPTLAMAMPLGDTEEYLLKAKCISFTLFYTQFPKGDSTQPWNVGVLGTHPFGANLSLVFSPTTTVKGRKVNLVFFRRGEEPKGVHVLYICRSEASRLDDVLEDVKGKPILTLSDIPGSAKRGVMVNLALEENHIRPEVNLRAARAVGLDFASSFLNFARVEEK